MADRMKVPVPNSDGTVAQEVGTLVKVVDSSEPWAEYVLEDGAKLRMKQTLINVVKLDKVADNGEPTYIVQSQQTLSVVPQFKE